MQRDSDTFDGSASESLKNPFLAAVLPKVCDSASESLKNPFLGAVLPKVCDSASESLKNSLLV